MGESRKIVATQGVGDISIVVLSRAVSLNQITRARIWEQITGARWWGAGWLLEPYYNCSITRQKYATSWKIQNSGLTLAVRSVSKVPPYPAQWVVSVSVLIYSGFVARAWKLCATLYCQPGVTLGLAISIKITQHGSFIYRFILEWTDSCVIASCFFPWTIKAHIDQFTYGKSTCVSEKHFWSGK